MIRLGESCWLIMDDIIETTDRIFGIFRGLEFLVKNLGNILGKLLPWDNVEFHVQIVFHRLSNKCRL